MPKTARPLKSRSCERCISTKSSCSGTQPCLGCQEVGLSRQCLFRGGLKILSKASKESPTPAPTAVKTRESHKSREEEEEDQERDNCVYDVGRELAFAQQHFQPSEPCDTVPGCGMSSSQYLPQTIPFFRYFGNTAIAPGLRFVEVELKDDHTTVFREHGGNDASSLPSNTPSSVNDPFPDLFDEDNSSLPNRRILHHLIPLFFSHMSCHLPFLRESRVMEAFENGSLEPLEANCICALASRFSDLPELVALRGEREKYTSAEPFAAMAKELVVPLFCLPSVKVCQALICITWIEWGSDRDAGAWLWSGLAIRISQDLGLFYTDTLLSLPDEELQQEYKLTFWAVYFIDRIISYGAGRAVAILQGNIEINLPTSTECHMARKQGIRSQQSSHPWPYLLMLLHHRGEISDKLNQRSSQSFLEDVAQGRTSMMEFFHKLPSDLRFNVSNLQKLSQLQLAPVLVIIHCLFHSIICLLHRPSLLQQTESHSSQLEAAGFDKNLCSSSAKTISDILSFSLLLDVKTIIANPYMDHAIYIGSLALLEELEELVIAGHGYSAVESSTDHANLWQRGSIIDKFETTRDCLNHLALHWGGIAWVCDWLNKRSRSLPDLKRYEDSRAIYRAAPTSVKMDMIKSLSKAHRSAQSLLCLTLPEEERNLQSSVGEEGTTELDWSTVLQSASNVDNLIFDGIHSLFETSGGTDISSLYHLAM